MESNLRNMQKEPNVGFKTYTLKIWILLFLTIFLIGVHIPEGSCLSSGNSETLNPKGRNQQLSSGVEGPLPYRIRILVWNIYKGYKWHEWRDDFQSLNFDRDLTLIQEAVTDGRMESILQNQSHQNWNFSYAHTFLGKPTGVASGCRCAIDKWDTMVSPIPEPILRTPKVSQVSWISLPQGERLLVINIHAINFRGMYPYRQQLEPIFTTIQNHHGPVIFAGDFNVWNRSRERFLTKYLIEKLGFEEVQFSNDRRWLKLDRVFLRGCKANQAQVLNHIVSSDHWPLHFEMDCHPAQE